MINVNGNEPGNPVFAFTVNVVADDEIPDDKAVRTAVEE